MANLIIQNFIKFRQSIMMSFQYTKDALMNLIDATAGQIQKDSVVKISLSELFLRQYSSISHAIANLFRKQSKGAVSEVERNEGSFNLTKLFVKQCPKAEKRPFALFGIDCTSHERPFADKLEDRMRIYVPNKVGQIPIGIGHQYSLVAFLPEKQSSNSPPWLVPLSFERVKSEQIGTNKGMNQLIKIIEEPEFRQAFCVDVADCAYSSNQCIKSAQQVARLVHIARLRCNRVFYYPLLNVEKPKGRGRPTRYGKKFHLKNAPKADEQIVLSQIIEYVFFMFFLLTLMGYRNYI